MAFGDWRHIFERRMKVEGNDEAEKDLRGIFTEDKLAFPFLIFKLSDYSLATFKYFLFAYFIFKNILDPLSLVQYFLEPFGLFLHFKLLLVFRGPSLCL